MPRIQLKISHKGFLLVAVPILFEAVLVAGLVHMLRVSDRAAADLTESRAIVACASELDKTLAFAGHALITWKMTQSQHLVKKYDDMAAQALKLCDHMADLAKHRTAAQQQHAARIKELCGQILNLTSNFRRPQDSPMLMLMNKGAYLAQIEHGYEQLCDETQALTEQEEQYQVGGSNSEVSAKRAIYIMIAMAVLFNAMLSVALSLYFSRNITRRVGVLSENARRLAAGNSLNEPVNGDDEIASLDRVFHKMANDLRETERRKQEFVAMVTHDLRTPLTSMRTIVTTLEEDADSRNSKDDLQRIAVVQRSLNRMINLVNDLLDIEKIESGMLSLELADTEIKEILSSAIEPLKPMATQRGITLLCPLIEDINEEPASLKVEIDAKRISQVLTNLIANAIKFSPKDSTVTVLAKSDGKWLNVRVVDEGRGIPELQRSAIFDRFKQAEQADSSVQGGSGLGLSISKALVELHHGTIGVESTVGKGSSFWFQIPLRQSQPTKITNA